MTEQTRLHYTWNAAERLLAAIRLPPVKDNRSAYAAATRLLADHWGGRARSTTITITRSSIFASTSIMSQT